MFKWVTVVAVLTAWRADRALKEVDVRDPDVARKYQRLKWVYWPAWRVVRSDYQAFESDPTTEAATKFQSKLQKCDLDVLFVVALIVLILRRRRDDFEQRFMGQIIHELRNKYTHAASLLETLSNRKGDPAAEEMRLSACLLYEADALIKARYDLHRVDQGLYREERTLVNLHDFATTVIAEAQSLTAKDVKITTNISKPTSIFIDERVLKHIVANLLGNARKWTTSGTIGFDLVDLRSDLATFRISDTGSGVPPNIHLFDESGLRLEARGAGVGLPSSRKFARAIGGDVWLSSSSELGSDFRFHLPCQICSEQAEIKKPIVKLKGKKIPVYIVEDSPMIRRTIMKKFQSLGDYDFYEYDTVESLKPLPSSGIVTVDENLESRGGILKGSDLIVALKTNDFPGLIISASGDATQRHIDLGAHFALGKPFPTVATFRNLLTPFVSVLTAPDVVTSPQRPKFF